jgi:hypothetical protein
MRILLVVLSLALAGPALAAGGAYVVDDSEIGEAGSCKLEAWVQGARHDERNLVAAPACVFESLSFVELGMALTRARAGGEWSTSVSPKAKVTLLPIERHGIGLGVAVGAGYATEPSKVESLTAAAFLSVQPLEAARVNFNLGWERDRTVPRDFATWGIGTDVQVAENWTAIAEAFGRDRGRPGLQLGIRPTILDGRVDLDLILGRNLSERRANWVTLGVTGRF